MESKILTDAQLMEIEEREKKATPGPWFQSLATVVGADSLFVADLISEQHQDKRVGQINDDGRFIAHARTDIPLLLATARLWKDEYNNLCGFTTDYENRCVELREILARWYELVEQMDHIEIDAWQLLEETKILLEKTK